MGGGGQYWEVNRWTSETFTEIFVWQVKLVIKPGLCYSGQDSSACRKSSTETELEHFPMQRSQAAVVYRHVVA
jgi:hypothetical protein